MTSVYEFLKGTILFLNRTFNVTCGQMMPRLQCQVSGSELGFVKFSLY